VIFDVVVPRSIVETSMDPACGTPIKPGGRMTIGRVLGSIVDVRAMDEESMLVGIEVSDEDWERLVKP